MLVNKISDLLTRTGKARTLLGQIDQKLKDALAADADNHDVAAANLYAEAKDKWRKFPLT